MTGDIVHIGEPHPNAARLFAEAHDALYEALARNHQPVDELRCNTATIEILKTMAIYRGDYPPTHPLHGIRVTGNWLFGLPLIIDDLIDDNKVVPYFARLA